jgi:two-component system CheB/CheR fusion protein
LGTDAGNEADERDGAEGASGAERQTAPSDDLRAPRMTFPVVGIGASAGGLEAYTEFLQAAPVDAGIAYVLVQHLPPDRETLLVELLARETRMPVLHAEHGQAVLPDHVFVIRPGHTLTIRDGHLWLGPELAARGHGRPVDDFFRSLAEEQQQRAVAVVFSGMGSNGSAGAQAVKAVGGLVVAQDPETARYPAMPRSVIDAHLADLILRPAEVPEALVRYARQPYAAADGVAAATPRDEQALADVLAVLRTRTRQDFSGYRKPTLLRRVRRRMGLCQAASMAEYVRALRQTPAEVTALANDLLIHVTGFFRDPEAWTVLQEKVIDPLVVERPDRGEIRCWVAACATGEEAYSLAMLLVEAAEARGKRFDIKVFATDMAERALGSARTGAFPNGIESEVTPERLARFFDKDDRFYRVKKELRELVIFAPQNVLQDPPFSRLDIATCRNLLIYLEPATQRRVLSLLHFGLREGGALLLGSSESAAPAEGDFEPIDKRHRLFRRVGPTRSGALELPTLTVAARDVGPAARPLVGRPPAQAILQLASRALLDLHTPPAVVVDAVGQVVHVHGETGRYLSLRPGGPSLDLMDLARDEIRGAVRTALRRAIDAQAATTVRDGLVDMPEGRRRIEIGAAPLGPRGGAPLYLVTFRDHPESPVALPSADDDASAAGRLADELQRTRNELQGALEEMQSSHEELKASHEEATSLNEELQSTNEELETSKEEMQSLNEELVTVNTQLQAKMSELAATANDLDSLLTSTDIAVLFLDPNFRIRRFTPAVKDLLDLIPSDIGRPFIDLRRKFSDPELLTDAQAVLDRLIPIERAIDSDSGRAYLRRVLPHRTQDNRIDGVVVAFVDITRRRDDEAARREAEERYLALFNAIDQGFCTIEVAFDEHDRAVDYRFLEVSPSFEQQTGIPDAAGRWMREIAADQDEHWFAAYGRVARTGVPERIEDYSTPLGRWWHVYAFRIHDPQLCHVGVLFTDVTDRRRAEERRTYLLRLSDALRPRVDPAEIQAAACRLLGEQLRADRAYYVEIDEDAGTAEVRQDYLRGGSPSLAGRHRLADFGRVIPPLRRGELLIVPDVDSSPLVPPAEREAMAAMQLAAHVSAPLVKAGRLVGALCVTEPVPRAWTAAEAELVRETGERIWAAVERAIAESTLRRSEEKYRTLFDSLDQGVYIAEVILDADGAVVDCRYLEVNRAVPRLTGLPIVAGKLLREVAPRLESHWREPFGRVVRTGEPTRIENYNQDTDRWYQAYFSRVGGEGSRLVGVVFDDITERKRAQARQALRLRLSDALRPLVDAADIAHAATRLLGEALVTDRVFYATVEPDGRTTLVRAVNGTPGDVARDSLATFVAELVRDWRPGRTTVTDDIDADPRPTDARRAAFAAASCRAAVGVPLIQGGRRVALLGVVHSSPRAWTADEVALVEETAARTWAEVERANAEAARRASEERLRAVAANLPNGAAFVVDRDLRYTLADGQALTAAGFTPADFEGKVLAEALPPELVDPYEPMYRGALDGKAFRVEHTAHGRQFVTHGEPLRDHAGRVTAVLAVSYDITDLRRAEARLQLALAAARMGIWTLDTTTGMHLRDANLNRLLGLAASETTQPFTDFLDHVHADDRAAVSAAFADSLRHGRPLRVEFRIVRPDGAIRWLRDQGDLFGDRAAGRQHMAGACVDVTERRAAEEAVRAGEERLRLILASATDYAIFTVAPDRTVTSWSNGAAATFGYHEAEIVGRPWDLLFTPEDRAAGVPELEFETAGRAGRARDERWHLRKDGGRFYASGVLTRLASGECVKVARDLTDRKRMEDELRDGRDRLEQRVAERTAELAAAVSSLEAEIDRRRELSLRLLSAQEDERKRVSRDLHDTVGQTHVALLMALAAAADAVPPDSAAAARLAYANKLAESMGHELHDVAVRLRPTTLDDLGLAAALKGLVHTWSVQQQVRVELQTDLDGRLPDEVETTLYRLVQEALTNVARHADATTVSVVVTVQPGQVTALVEDDGAGFDPQTADTTRLGLRGMRERVTLIGGELVVESSPGAGTSILARVPLREPPHG